MLGKTSASDTVFRTGSGVRLKIFDTECSTEHTQMCQANRVVMMKTVSQSYFDVLGPAVVNILEKTVDNHCWAFQKS